MSRKSRRKKAQHKRRASGLRRFWRRVRRWSPAPWVARVRGLWAWLWAPAPKSAPKPAPRVTARPASPRRAAGPQRPAPAPPPPRQLAPRHRDWTTLIQRVRHLPFPSAWTPHGHVRTEDGVPVLDLHGLDVATTHMAVNAFVHDAHAQGYRDVRVICGRGNNSGERGPQLPGAVRTRLEMLATDGLVDDLVQGKGHFDVVIAVGAGQALGAARRS